MTRVDYLNDPAAPKANSMVTAVSAVVPDDQGRILLIRRTDNNYWSIPGGGVEPGESVSQATAREVREETGIECEVTGLVGIYSDPNHVAAYDDGEVRQEFSICFRATALGGTPRTSSESSEVRFVAVQDILNYEIHPSIRLRIQHYLEARNLPYIGWPSERTRPLGSHGTGRTHERAWGGLDVGSREPTHAQHPRARGRVRVDIRRWPDVA
jgi:ADP-ribose pyrophosphatase YjhB (NUDIX family)